MDPRGGRARRAAAAEPMARFADARGPPQAGGDLFPLVRSASTTVVTKAGIRYSGRGDARRGVPRARHRPSRPPRRRPRLGPAARRRRRPHRHQVRPRRDPRPRPGLSPGPARAGPAEELLATGRADRRAPTPPQPLVASGPKIDRGSAHFTSRCRGVCRPTVCVTRRLRQPLLIVINTAKDAALSDLTAGISQEKLGELAGLHGTYVSSVGRGERNISLENIDGLARALGVKMAELMPD